MPPQLRWRASSAPSPGMPRTARGCCGASAIIAARAIAPNPPPPPPAPPPPAPGGGGGGGGGVAGGGEGDENEALSIPPVTLDAANCPDVELTGAARRSWDRALALGEQHGFRNAQAT